MAMVLFTSGIRAQFRLEGVPGGLQSPISWSGCSEPFPVKTAKPASMGIPESFWVTCIRAYPHTGKHLGL